jgi:hypothetical protein
MADNEEDKSGEDIVREGGWANCATCEQIYLRLRQTARFCSECDNAFCEGEHGSTSYRFMCNVCILKNNKKYYRHKNKLKVAS